MHVTMYQETVQLTKHKTEYVGVSKFRCLPGHRHEGQKKTEVSDTNLSLCFWTRKVNRSITLVMVDHFI